MDNSKTLSRGLSGVAGEYMVAGQLSNLGYLATITLRNSKGIDILCSNEKGDKIVSIQVKTNQRSERGWVLDEKSEKMFNDKFFYVFVNLNTNTNKAPDFFIVPSQIVADTIKKGHNQWINTPNKKGGKHIETSMRKFRDIDGKFLNKWNLLGL
jgi:hypothetical protein